MKNIKLTKRFISMLTAGVLMGMPVIANGSDNSDENTNNTRFTLVKQEMKVKGYDLNINNYINKLEKSYNYLKQFIDYDYLQADLQILYYMTNRSYMSTDTNTLLIENGIVYGEDYIKENFNQAFDLIYRINEYNENIIRNDYLNNTMDINHLIDISVLCYDSHDQKIVRSMLEHYFEAYKNNLFENEDYTSVFKELTTLNAQEKEHNAHSLMTGAMWLSQITIGRNVIEMLHDDLLRDYSKEELFKYFVKEELNNGKWVLRDDVLFDLNCLSELENEIFNLEELETFCYELVNNNIYKMFNITETIEDSEIIEEIEVIEDEENDIENSCSYSESVAKAYEYLSSKIGYDHLQSDLQCLVYLTNREYLEETEENELINNGIVYQTNFETEEGLQNFMQAYSLINIILDYNQSVIRNDYNDGKMDINHLIDPSVLCMNVNDKKIVHEMHVNYFEAYKNNRFENKNYYAVLKELINNQEISMGSMWLARNIVGGDLMQLLRDDMQNDFKPEEIVKYFDKKEYNAGQWILKEDVALDSNASYELEREAYSFKELWPFVYDNVNNDLMASFQVDCTKSK